MIKLKTKKASIRFILFFALSSFLMIGCEKEIMTIEESSILTETERSLTLPKVIRSNNHAITTDYLNSISFKEESLLLKSFHIAEYLKSTGNLQKVLKNNPDEKLLINLDYSNILNKETIAEINSISQAAAAVDPCLQKKGVLAYINYPASVTVDNCTGECTGCGVGTCTWHITYTFKFSNGNSYSGTNEDTGTCCDLGCGGCPENLSRDQAISMFLKNDISKSLKRTSQLYVKHSNELNTILLSEDEKYKSIQKSFTNLRLVYGELIDKTFVRNDNIILEQNHIQSATEFLDELSKIVTTPELKETIGILKDNLHIMQDKELKEALKVLDKKELNL